MKKPLTIAYGVGDTPPLGVTLFSALQHVALVSIRLLFPLLVAREAGVTGERLLDVVGVSLIIMGTATVLQAFRWGPLGCGYLCPPSFTSAYIAPSLLAAKTGGMALVAGMTLFGGSVEAALSRLLRPLRPFFPSEIAGFVVVMVSLTLGSLGTRSVFGIGAPAAAGPRDLAVTAVSLATMVAFNIWTRGAPRVFCALLGMAAGYIAAAVAGILTIAHFKPVGNAPLFHLPQLGMTIWSFDAALMIPFVVGALAASLRAMGDVTMCQKISDAEWTRPNIGSLSGGVLANGVSTAAAALLGTIGVNTLSSGVALSAATGVVSRRVAYVTGAMFLALAFLPKAAALFVIMPRPVVGATLWFAAAFALVNGLQIVTSRMLDARRTLVIGLSFTVGLAVDLYPSFFAGLPSVLQPYFGSSLVLGTMSALLLNGLFRLGVRRRQTLAIDLPGIDLQKVADFMEAQGAAWGARRDVIERARFNLLQSIEVIVESCGAEGTLEIAASFDEFSLDLSVSYTGLPLTLPDTRPSNEEIMASEEGARKLAGFMMRRHADRVHVVHRGGRSTILFHFDH